MIFSYPEVERFSFILDLNDATPFRGGRYTTITDERWYPYKLSNVEGPLPATFQRIEEWLQEHTAAYRFNTATMVHAGSFEALEPNYRDPPMITAMVVEMPEAVAALFRLFWYD